MHMTEYVEKKKWQGFKMLKNGSHQSAFWLSRSSLLHGRKREERWWDAGPNALFCGHPFSQYEREDRRGALCTGFTLVLVWDILDVSSFFGIRLLTNSLSSNNKAPIKPTQAKVRVWSTVRTDFARKKWEAKSTRDNPTPSPTSRTPLKKKKQIVFLVLTRDDFGIWARFVVYCNLLYTSKFLFRVKCPDSIPLSLYLTQVKLSKCPDSMPLPMLNSS